MTAVSDSGEVTEAWVAELQDVAEQLDQTLKLIHFTLQMVKQGIKSDYLAPLIVEQLSCVRQVSDLLGRRIVLDLVTVGRLNPLEAAKASGYSRISIHNWLRNINKSPAAR